MKKLLILAALFPVLVFGQTTSQNYVKTKAYKVPTLTTITTPTLSQAAQNITYFDGLGRPIEKVAYKQSGTGHDIVIPVTYDKWGRQPKDYLPVVSGQTLNYHGIDSTAVISYYSTPLLPTMEATTYPYSEKLLEDSPLNRIFKQASPGDDWHLGAGNEVKMDYQTNEAGGSSSVTGSVRLYTVSGGWNSTDEKYDIGLYDNGNYLADSLYVTITKNENWQPADGGHNTTEEFKDKQGRVVLKRTFGVSLVGGSTVDEAHDTYYVYDDYGNLTFVIPPIVDATVAVTQTMLDDLCYQYIYDARNRLVEKKLPGKQWEFIVYNNQDKPVATGPVLNPWGLGGQGWLITKYDAFGRVAYTGWYNETAPDASGRKALQDLMPTSWAEKRDAGAAQIDDVTIKYTNDVYPTDLKLLTINYYDSYDNPYAVTPPSYIEGEAVLAKPVTLPTTSWVRVLTAPDETQAETVTTFYDTKGQVIGTRKTNHLGGHTNTDSKLDFTGKADYTICKHTFNSSPPEITVKDTYEYSDQDRLLVHKHQINSLPEELIAKNDYDDLGQLISKQVGGEDTTAYAGLQKVDYRYNIRGWLTDINNIDTLSIGSNPEDLFAFKINYNKSYHNEFAVPALYNGNISETLWVSSTDNVQRKYNYQYDNLNRLRYARYEKPQGIGITDMYDEQVDYDKNGNIQHLNRNGDFDADDELHIFNIDQLNYTYDTDNKNRLMRVEDTTTSTLGFKDDNSTGSDPDDDYTYDDFGNMLSDTNKKIDSISYNHLNLPIRIIFAGGNKIQYLYNAAGQKVRKTVTKSSTDTVTDYQDGFQYSDSKLSFFNHAEGYVNVLYCSECEVKTRYNYVFNYLDHLGNIRMSYAVDPDDNVLKILEENHYYPFGLKHTNYNSGAKGFEKKEGEPEKTKIDEISPFENPFYKYKYQGTERQDELGLNWDSFKYRNYDYAIGRFMFIDPLAEKYPYNSTYAFQENKIGMGRELEGLELGGAQFNNYAANFGKEVTGFFDNASTQVSAFVGVVVDIIPGVLSVDSTVEASANTNFTNYAMSSTYSNYGDSNLFKNFDVSFENKFVVEAKKTVSTGIADVTVSHTESKSTKTGKKESESKIIVGSGESGVFVSKTKDGKEKSKTKFGVQVEKSVPVAPGINIKAGARLTMEKKQ